MPDKRLNIPTRDLITDRAKMCVLAAVVLAASACGNSEGDYSAGYDDGYAVGYNTACEIRATLVAGEWDNPNYSRGYADGQSAGTIACNEDRRAARIL